VIIILTITITINQILIITITVVILIFIIIVVIVILIIIFIIIFLIVIVIISTIIVIFKIIMATIIINPEGYDKRCSRSNPYRNGSRIEDHALKGTVLDILAVIRHVNLPLSGLCPERLQSYSISPNTVSMFYDELFIFCSMKLTI
jgi:hypothetical protein